MILENGKRMEDAISSLRQTAAVPDMNLDKSFISMIPQEPDKSLDVSRSTLDFKLAMTDKVLC